MEFVDTHCHLQLDAFATHEDKVLAAASAAGVKKIICVGTDLADSKLAIDLAHTKKDVWAAVGVHPHEAPHFLADPNGSKKLRELATQDRVVAVGETGLDFYKSETSPADQEQSLRAHIKIGLDLDLPLIFHVRDGWADFWRIFDEYKNLRGVVHSFSSGPKQLQQVLSRGLYVGLNGIMTFTRDEAQLEAARQVPLNRLLLETDAPFLAPTSVRGQQCEPKHVVDTAKFLADLRGEKLEDLAAASTTNAIELFDLGSNRG